MLKELMVETKEAWVDYPGLEGFKVKVVNLGRERLIALRKGCIISKFDRKTRASYEELDEKKFVKEFTNATVKDWKGLKLGYLETLMLVDLQNSDLDKEVPFTPEDAELLVSNSGDFDAWLNEVVFDLERFRTGGGKPAVGKVGKLAE